MTTIRRKRKTIRRQRLIDPLRLQGRVNQIFERLSCPLPGVTVEITTEDGVLATAQGVTFLTISFGKIKISWKLLDLLTDAEIEFVLAHEAAHIYLNHLVGTGSFTVARVLAEDAARSDPNVRVLLTVWDVVKLLIFKGGNLPPFAALTKEQELDADAWAVFLTGNKAAAHSALLKLAGNNPGVPSHTWEVLDATLPVMTIKERLSALDIRFRTK